MKRRKFIATSAAATISTALATKSAEAKPSNKKFRWKMATTWSPKMPILQDSVERFAKKVKIASGGRLKIKVFAGGELIPPLSVFDAVTQGTIQAGAGSAYYWSGKVSAAQFFSSVPFGMNPQHTAAWLEKEGLALWEEIYKPFGVKPFPFGYTGIQMGGWFKKPLNSVADLKGLKMRIPGFGGKVMAKAGANVVLLPGSEVYTALERGTIDATEWISPFHDERLGLHRAAKYYYYPGWHEPSGMLELIIADRDWNELPADLQEIVSIAAQETASWVHNRSEAENGPALQRLINKHNVKVLPFPDEVIQHIRKWSDLVVSELAETSDLTKRINHSYRSFQESVAKWGEVSEVAFARARSLPPQ